MTAEKKYVEFHSHAPEEVGRFHGAMTIPREAKFAGNAVHILYASDKLNPTTGEDEGWIDYIHEHQQGVKLLRTDAHFSGPSRVVPKWIWSCRTLTWLGECLGFAYIDPEGYEVKAEATKPRPELYTTPNGRALLVIQSRRRVVAILWGGKLGVERRGIVG